MESIQLLRTKIKHLKDMTDRSFWVNIIVLTIVIICGFLLGLWVGKGSAVSSKTDPVIIYTNGTSYPKNQTTKISSTPISNISKDDAGYFGSKRGKKLYPISCLSQSNIKPENRVYFMDIASGENSGLTPSDGC